MFDEAADFTVLDVFCVSCQQLLPGVTVELLSKGEITPEHIVVIYSFSCAILVALAPDAVACDG